MNAEIKARMEEREAEARWVLLLWRLANKRYGMIGQPKVTVATAPEVNHD